MYYDFMHELFSSVENRMWRGDLKLARLAPNYHVLNRTDRTTCTGNNTIRWELVRVCSYVF